MAGGSIFGGCLVTGGRCTGKAEQATWQSQRAGRRVPKHLGCIRGNCCGCPGKREAYGRVERSITGRIKSYFQETRWAGTKARNADGYKLWYSGVVRGKNRVGILVDRDLRESVVEVRRVNDRLMFIKLVIGECTLNVVSAYAPQAGLDEEVKRRFWEGLDEIVRSIPPTERLFIGGDFTANSYGEVHGGFGFGDRNGGGTSLLDFAKAFELVIANSTFPKREEHLVTFRSSAVKTQIDYLLLRRCDRGLCKDCKVIPGETLATQHRLLVMDIGIMMKRKKRYARGRPRIRWGALTKDKAQELEGRLSAMGSWRRSGDASTMWSTMANYVREAAREVLGVSKGFSGRPQGDWWWNDTVQGKVEAKKVAYAKLAGSTSEEERSANRESSIRVILSLATMIKGTARVTENSLSEVGELRELMQKMISEIGTLAEEVSNLKKLDQIVLELQEQVTTATGQRREKHH
ncbi:PREDICTED: uncharacterized protein LOC109237393 [Nicotiana attenuata]|uniref:uncharacterized protein LOC109237393 n=1 Tax=Nicotiana attenuata TaxID=49451 RepID=UPI000904E839|nr:PREDICTED: uncharacterized protein LOC109237393 [Nicotiana attenuata]